MICQPFHALRPEATGRYIIVCDHASNFVPSHLSNLGLAAADLQRHIAWDIGAAAITTLLSELLDSPAVLSDISRLVIDCNRQLAHPALIPNSSDGMPIPGNQSINESERLARIHEYFEPYHSAIEALIESRLHRPSVLLSVHSMTPVLNGQPRPWLMALSSYTDRSLSDPLLAILRRSGLSIGDNEPYDLDPAVDFTTPYHAIRRDLPHIQVEFRQDEIESHEGQQEWANFFAESLEQLSADLTGDPGSLQHEHL